MEARLFNLLLITNVIPSLGKGFLALISPLTRAAKDQSLLNQSSLFTLCLSTLKLQFLITILSPYFRHPLHSGTTIKQYGVPRACAHAQCRGQLRMDGDRRCKNDWRRDQAHRHPVACHHRHLSSCLLIKPAFDWRGDIFFLEYMYKEVCGDFEVSVRNDSRQQRQFVFKVKYGWFIVNVTFIS